MPKSRQTRRGRRRGGRPPVRPPAPAEAPTRAVAAPLPVAPAGEREVERPRRRVGRRTTRDYTYVSRDVRRVLILATAVLITIVVLSFFLP